MLKLVSFTVRCIEDFIEFQPEKSSDVYQYALHYFTEKGILKSKWSPHDKSVKFKVQLSKGVHRYDIFFKIGNESYKVVNSFWVGSDGRIFQPKLLKLFESQSIIVEHYFNNSNVTFVVFNQAGTSLNSKVFGLDYLMCKGFNVIGVKQNGDCYQSLNEELFRGIIEPYATTKMIYYGSSLGGYAALYYGTFMDSFIISVSPLVPIEDNVLKINNRVPRGFTFKHNELFSFKRTSKRSVIFLDPHQNADLYFYHRYIEKTYSLEFVNLIPFSGHAALYHLNHTKQLNNIIESFVLDIEFKIDLSIDSHFSCYEKYVYYKNLEIHDYANYWIKRALEFPNLTSEYQQKYKNLLPTSLLIGDN